MKIKNIDIKMIDNLLKGVPDEMDLQSIEFSGNSVRLNFTASYEVLQKENQKRAAQELFQLIQAIDKKQNLSEIDNK